MIELEQFADELGVNLKRKKEVRMTPRFLLSEQKKANAFLSQESLKTQVHIGGGGLGRRWKNYKFGLGYARLKKSNRYQVMMSSTQMV